MAGSLSSGSNPSGTSTRHPSRLASSHRQVVETPKIASTDTTSTNIDVRILALRPDDGSRSPARPRDVTHPCTWCTPVQLANWSDHRFASRRITQPVKKRTNRPKMLASTAPAGSQNTFRTHAPVGAGHSKSFTPGRCPERAHPWSRSTGRDGYRPAAVQTACVRRRFIQGILRRCHGAAGRGRPRDPARLPLADRDDALGTRKISRFAHSGQYFRRK